MLDHYWAAFAAEAQIPFLTDFFLTTRVKKKTNAVCQRLLQTWLPASSMTPSGIQSSSARKEREGSLGVERGFEGTSSQVLWLPLRPREAPQQTPTDGASMGDSRSLTSARMLTGRLHSPPPQEQKQTLLALRWYSYLNSNWQRGGGWGLELKGWSGRVELKRAIA